MGMMMMMMMTVEAKTMLLFMILHSFQRMNRHSANFNKRREYREHTCSVHVIYNIF